MMKKVRKGIILGLSCVVISGGVKNIAFASGNVANTMFHFTVSSNSYTEIRYKDDNTRTYAIVSDAAAYAKVTVMGTNKAYDTYNHACSSECKLKRYTEYTIKNNVYGHYKYAVLRSKSADNISGSGLWSPDSTKNYKNIGD